MSTKKNTVFILEDEEITYVQISYFLKLRGFEVIGQSTTGEDAISKILKLHPDVVLVDINLAGKLNGIETTELVLKEYLCPIIYITSDDSQATLERLMVTRPYGFLRKPLRFDALCNTIELALQRFQTEQQLKESEALFSQVVNSLVGYALVMLKPDGSIYNWNESAEKMFGFKKEDTINIDFSFLFSENKVKENLPIQILENVLKHGSDSREVTLNRKNNSPLSCHVSITPIRNSIGDLKGFAAVIKDISEEKKIENERKELSERLKKYNEELELRVQQRTLELNVLNQQLENEINIRKLYEKELEKSRSNLLKAEKLAQIGNWEIELKTKKVNLSEETLNLLELNPESELDFEEFLNIILPEDQELEHLDAILQKELEYEYDKEFVTKTGNSRFFNIIIQRQRTVNDDKSYFGIIHDITLRKRAEIEINKALEKEREINQMKERFVWMISHEFRTPLTVIQSNLEFLERFGDTASGEKKIEFIQKALSACKRINDLLEDILQIGKLKDKKIFQRPTLFNLKEFSELLIEELQTTNYGNNRIILEVEGKDFDCLHDKKIIRQILVNLLLNALKYSPQDKKVIFHIQAKENDFIIQVKDEGIGIPEEDLEKIFKDFFRSSNVGNVKGSGLGLALVKEYLEILNGEVHVESILNKGSVFTIKFSKQNKENV